MPSTPELPFWGTPPDVKSRTARAVEMRDSGFKGTLSEPAHMVPVPFIGTQNPMTDQRLQRKGCDLDEIC